MTQIVYDGRYLLADRKCSRGSTTVQSVKVRHNEKDGVKRYWAFSGSFLDCSLGDDVVESGFDKRAIERAQALINIDDLHNYYGLLVEVTSEGRKVFLINYTGDKCEVPQDQFIVVGAMYEEITYSYKAWKKCNELATVRAGLPLFDKPLESDHNERLRELVSYLRFILDGTRFDQSNGKFDCYDLDMGGKYQYV